MRQRLVWLTLCALALLPGAAQGQYFGQNKVQYRRFDWQIIRSEHFDIHYYGEMRAAALDAARMSERAYARLSRILQHEFIERKPLILYASQSDFVQTNTTGGDVGEGTGGFTDFYRHRMVLPFTGSYADFEHVLMHEMVHGFQYDIYARGRAGAGFQTLAQVNPPLWFMEGMAEYLSIGPISPHTAMWMRDAALQGGMPTIEQLTYDTRFFPYRFGHALWAYVAQKWGDESVGAIMHATLAGGIERAFQRTLGLTLEQLGDEWIEAVQNSYLPLIAEQQRPRSIARPSLVARKTKGRYNLAPQISPDGRQVIFLSERSILSVDLYIADTEGRQITRLLSSGFDPDFETFRFINSAGSWSQDGREFVLTSKSGGEDILIFVDVRRRRVSHRLRLGFEGILNPSFSPDGTRITFTGLRGGWSDLYVVNRDGSGLRRLTSDAYAELMPQWSPDGRTIAFTTDRGPDTDFSVLRFGDLKIALYWLDGDSISILPRMDEGKNTNPVWSPDGTALAFLSDRNGASNVYLYDFVTRDVYQLSRAFTGITGITDLSPAISWARQADRVALTYYEDGAYNVYIAESPRSLQRSPYRTDPAAVLLLANASAQPLRTPASGLARGPDGGRVPTGPGARRAPCCPRRLPRRRVPARRPAACRRRRPRATSPSPSTAGAVGSAPRRLRRRARPRGRAPWSAPTAPVRPRSRWPRCWTVPTSPCRTRTSSGWRGTRPSTRPTS